MRVMLVDDRALTLSGLRSILDGRRGVTVVGEAQDKSQALQMAESLRPDAVVVEALSERIDPLDLVSTMTGRFGTESPAVILLANVPEARLKDAYRAGARALLLKHSSPDELISALQMTTAGYVLMAPAIEAEGSSRDHYSGIDKIGVRRQLQKLTDRELDVLELLARGHSNSEISERLFVSESTAKSHVRNVLAKLRLRNRVQAVIFAYQSGLLRAGAGERSYLL